MNIQDISDYIYRILPDPIFYQMRYFRKHRRFCNFKNPSYFSEKIYHRMRYPKPIFTVMADKVLVRDFIAEKVGEQYLVPVYFSCSKVSISTFDKLPKSFVMKANHSAGQVIIVVDKSQEDLSSLAKTANDWLATDFTDVAREKHYGCVRPQIIFEKALLNNGMSPDDYKVNVFNKLNTSESFLFIQHMSGRSDLLTQNLYLEDWAPAPFDRLGEEKGERSHVKPFFLDEMVKVSKDVSREFGYVRVDFYIHEERLYIGELTLTPAAGAYKFKPSEWDYKLGQMFGWPESV
jgi:hypothetical protein